MLRVFVVISLLICGCQSAPEVAENTDEPTAEKAAAQQIEEPQPAVSINTAAKDFEKNSKPAEIVKPPETTRSAARSVVKKPAIAFADPSFDFGEIFHAEKVTHQFEFVNEGNRDLEIKSAKASCGCTTPSYPFLPIAPGETGFIGVTYNSVGKQGFQRANIRVATNDPDRKEVVLKLKGRVKVKPKAEYEAEQAAKKKKKNSG